MKHRRSCALVLCSLCGAAAIVSQVGPTGTILAEGLRRPWTSSRITGTPTRPAPYRIRPAFGNLRFESPTSLTELPGGRWMVSEIGGRISSFSGEILRPKAETLLELPGAAVWHATIHPEFERNGQLFVCYSRAGRAHVSRFTVHGTPPAAKPEDEAVVLTWPGGGHMGGCLAFGTDGMLYISTGDGAGPNPPDSLDAGQDVSNLLGCILRVDVGREEGGRRYVVPSDNPFVSRPGARPEIWSFGLRNPWKFGIDGRTGDLFVADNGWESWEMIHRVVRGGNCGWPVMEGRAILRSEVPIGPTPIRPPIKDHPHSEANSVIGGPVYRAAKYPDLDGTFIYGDYITGTIWGLRLDGRGGVEHRTLVDTDQRITAFAASSDGRVYVVDYDYTGRIYELVPSPAVDRSADFPRRLSETGLFASTETLEPAPGVEPYDVVVDRWIDGAEARRWVAIPGTKPIALAQGDRAAEFPEGTVLVKHLTLAVGGGSEVKREETPIETQILHLEEGVWRPYSYLWDEDGKDAALVDPGGGRRELADGRTWRVSAENECRLCHNVGSGHVLGFVPNQLSRPAAKVGARNQLLELSSRGVVMPRRPVLPGEPAHLVDPHETKDGLEARARSYLHGNCGSCHHPGGNAIVSFFLHRELPFESLRVSKSPGVGRFGLREPRLIAPGDPFRSVLLYRMSKLGYARMPYIGSQLVDSRGVALVADWIRSMEPDRASELSPPRQEGSAESRALARLAKNPLDTSAVRTLLASSEGALALASEVHRGDVDRAVARVGYAHRSSDVRGLFETFLPERDRRRTLGSRVDSARVLALDGDAARGRLIFSSDSARCKTCHHFDDGARSVGPTLREIRRNYSRAEEILAQIVTPSLKVDEKFSTWTAVMSSGQVRTGLLVENTPARVRLRDAEGKIVAIPRADVVSLERGKDSLMPSGVLADLTAQEAADLLAWLVAIEPEKK